MWAYRTSKTSGAQLLWWSIIHANLSIILFEGGFRGPQWGEIEWNLDILLGCVILITRRLPTSCKWSYSPYEWFYNWVAGVIYNPSYRSFNPSYNWSGPIVNGDEVTWGDESSYTIPIGSLNILRGIFWPNLPKITVNINVDECIIHWSYGIFTSRWFQAVSC